MQLLKSSLRTSYHFAYSFAQVSQFATAQQRDRLCGLRGPWWKVFVAGWAADAEVAGKYCFRVASGGAPDERGHRRVVSREGGVSLHEAGLHLQVRYPADGLTLTS